MRNDAAERAIRPTALGGKNSLFASSDAEGRRAAINQTLIETAKLNDVEGVLRALPDHMESCDREALKIKELAQVGIKKVEQLFRDML